MIPAEKIIGTETDEGVSYRKESAVVSDSFDKNVLVSPTPEGLSDENVQELKELEKSGNFEAFWRGISDSTFGAFRTNNLNGYTSNNFQWRHILCPDNLRTFLYLQF